MSSQTELIPIVRRALIGCAAAHFCAGFGSRGEYNFGPLGRTEEVADAEARRRDRQTSTRIGLASLAIGLAVGAAAVAIAR